MRQAFLGQRASFDEFLDLFPPAANFGHMSSPEGSGL